MEIEPTQQSTQQWDEKVSLTESFSDPKVILTINSTSGLPARYELRGDSPDRRWTFGRGKQCNFQLDPSKRRISNTHFYIWATSDEPPVVMITDCSTNGTAVNGTRITKGKNSMLVHGDTITVGMGVPEDEMEFVCLFSRDARAAATTGFAAKYELGEMIGSGAFAKVRLAIDRDNGKRFAVKIIEKSRIHGNIAVEREIDVLRRLQHENIVCLHDFYDDDNFYYLVMDYVPEGDLMAQVEKYRLISETDGREIMYQVLCAIAYVHDMGVSHRDLKPENILVQSVEPFQIKITDFGLAKISAQNSFLKTFCGTLSYLAPEVLQSRTGKAMPRGYSNRVDMWSVGCLAYVILTGYMPFDGNTQEDLYRAVFSGNYNTRPIIDAGLSAECQDFIRTMLAVDPAERPDAITALQHPWILGMSSESVEADESNVNSQSLAAIAQSSGIGFDERMNKLNLVSSQFSRLPPPPMEEEHDSEEDAADMAGNRNVSQPGIRSFSEADLDEMSDCWMTLSVMAISIPFKDVGISSDSLLIGRQKDLNQLVINEPLISRIHCRIFRKKGPDDVYQVWFQDLSSSGCAINGTKLGKMKQCRLYNEDKIGLFVQADPKGTGIVRNLSFTAQIVSRDVQSVRVREDLEAENIPGQDIPPEAITLNPTKRTRMSSDKNQHQRVTRAKTNI